MDGAEAVAVLRAQQERRALARGGERVHGGDGEEGGGHAVPTDVDDVRDQVPVADEFQPDGVAAQFVGAGDGLRERVEQECAGRRRP